jgi:fructose-1-phosphate kinase PfkB-like protein
MGAVLLTSEGAWSARLATKDVPVRTVGCGDHLLAGFVAEMTAGKDQESALVTALAVATARAMSPRMEEFDVEIMRQAVGNVTVERI